LPAALLLQRNGKNDAQAKAKKMILKPARIGLDDGGGLSSRRVLFSDAIAAVSRAPLWIFGMVCNQKMWLSSKRTGGGHRATMAHQHEYVASYLQAGIAICNIQPGVSGARRLAAKLKRK
jgi:hypothetical protein